MTIRYFISSEADLDQVSQFAYCLGQPNTQSTVSKRIFGVRKHPTDDMYYVAIDGTLITPVCNTMKTAYADLDHADLVEVYPDAVERETIRDKILNADPNIAVMDLIPSRWTEKPRTEMESEGWFPDPLD